MKQEINMGLHYFQVHAVQSIRDWVSLEFNEVELKGRFKYVREDTYRAREKVRI